MGKLFDKYVRLHKGFVYERDAYDKRPGCDPEIIAQGLAPITEVERRGMAIQTPVDVELLTHKLSSIVEEARDVYMSLSISEGIITGDMNCGLFTASGDPVVVGTGIYFHTLLNNAQLKYILKYYRDDPSVGLRDGDIYFFNEELAGGVHNMDMFTAMPIFWQGELVAWAECGGHQGETGSITPGGFAPTAKSRYEEGIHIPCMRIGENFLLRRDVLDFMTGSVRNSFVFEADLRSRVATMMRIRERFLREIERKGVEYVAGGMRQILVDGERNARTRLREINDGVFRSILFNDDHGTFFGLTRVPLTIIKEGEELAVLIQGVSPECKTGPFNASWHLTRAATAVYLFSYFFRGYLPANAGLLEPVRYYVEGPTLMNSSAELAHGLANQVCAFATQNLYIAGAKMLFASPHREAVQAPQSRNYSLPIFSGLNRRGYLSMNYTGAANAGGGGARFDMDGENALGFYWGPWTDAGEIEEQDDRMAMLTLARKLDKNFHGYGKFRGGTPLLEVNTFCSACAMSSWGSCDKVTFNFGLFGGYAGPPNPRFVIRDTDLMQQIKDGKDLDLGQYELLKHQQIKGDYVLSSSSKDAQRFETGDIVVSSVGAGGGYGDVLDRAPELVVKDLEDELITADVAEAIYGVVIDPDTKLVDRAKTDTRREAIRAERRAKAVPFNAFIKDWLKLKPKPEILEHYGNWPEPHLETYEKPFWGFLRLMRKLAPNPERMLFAPLIWRLALKLEQVVWSDVARDPGEAVFVLRSAQRLFKQDIICPAFDTWMEAEAAGAAVERDDLGRVTNSPAQPADLASADDVLRDALVASTVEVVRRLAADESAVIPVGTMTGVATLLGRVGANRSDFARDVMQGLGRAYCEAGAGALVLLEEETVGDIAALSSLLNIAEYYATPVFILSRMPVTQEQIATAQSAGIGLIGPNCASDGIALIDSEAQPADTWIAMTNWELSCDTDPGDVEAVLARLRGTT